MRLCHREAACCAKTSYTNMYARQLERWLSFFRRDQVMIPIWFLVPNYVLRTTCSLFPARDRMALYVVM